MRYAQKGGDEMSVSWEYLLAHTCRDREVWVRDGEVYDLPRFSPPLYGGEKVTFLRCGVHHRNWWRRWWRRPEEEFDHLFGCRDCFRLTQGYNPEIVLK